MGRTNRTEVATQTLLVIRMLLKKPRRPLDLMEELDLSRRTIDRLLRAMEGAGLKFEVERVSRDAFYSLKPESVKKALGL